MSAAVAVVRIEDDPRDRLRSEGPTAAAIPERCDNCGALVVNPYTATQFQGRVPRLCSDCLHKIARGVAQANRAASGRAA